MNSSKVCRLDQIDEDASNLAPWYGIRPASMCSCSCVRHNYRLISYPHYMFKASQEAANWIEQSRVLNDNEPLQITPDLTIAGSVQEIILVHPVEAVNYSVWYGTVRP
jgi:hypothetical protein